MILQLTNDQWADWQASETYRLGFANGARAVAAQSEAETLTLLRPDGTVIVTAVRETSWRVVP